MRRSAAAACGCALATSSLLTPRVSVCVPAAAAQRVAELAEGYARDDRLAADALRTGLSFREVMGKFQRI
jgi:hypothetical protein